MIIRVQQSFWIPKCFAYTHIVGDRWQFLFSNLRKNCLPVLKGTFQPLHASGHSVHRRNSLISADMLLHTKQSDVIPKDTRNPWLLGKLQGYKKCFGVSLLHVASSFACYWRDLWNRGHFWRSVIMSSLLEMCLPCRMGYFSQISI